LIESVVLYWRVGHLAKQAGCCASAKFLGYIRFSYRPGHWALETSTEHAPLRNSTELPPLQQPIAKIHRRGIRPPKPQILRRTLNDTPSRELTLAIKISPTTPVFHQKTRQIDFAWYPE